MFTDPEVIKLSFVENTEYTTAVIDIDRGAYLSFGASEPYDGYGALPSRFVLYQNYPNPFNPTTTIRFDLPEDTRAYMDLYDILDS